MLRLAPLVAAALLLAVGMRAPAQNMRVDLELVLAVDVSGSVDFAEARLQRNGYIEAFLDPKLLQAIQNGRHGRIAVTYVEWAGWGLFRQLVDWTVISDRQSAEKFVRAVDRWDTRSYQGTSISGALELSMQVLNLNP